MSTASDNNDLALFEPQQRVRLISEFVQQSTDEHIPQNTLGTVEGVQATGTKNRNGYYSYKYVVNFDNYGKYVGIPEQMLDEA